MDNSLYWSLLILGVAPIAFGLWRLDVVLYNLMTNKTKENKLEVEVDKVKIEQMKTRIDALISEISQFVADRQLSYPPMTTGADRISINEWHQRNAQYSATTNSLFVARFSTKIMDIGYDSHEQGLLVGKEWDHFKRITQPDYPVIHWILGALKEYRAKLG